MPTKVIKPMLMTSVFKRETLSANMLRSRLAVAVKRISFPSSVLVSADTFMSGAVTEKSATCAEVRVPSECLTVMTHMTTPPRASRAGAEQARDERAEGVPYTTKTWSPEASALVPTRARTVKAVVGAAAVALNTKRWPSLEAGVDTVPDDEDSWKSVRPMPVLV